MQYFFSSFFVFFGAVGYCLKFSIKPPKIFWAAFGGVLSNAIFTIICFYYDNMFVACLLAALFATCYAEAFARIKKSPATVFLIPSIIPLVPGGFLYYAMNNYVNKNEAGMSYYASATVQAAIGISIGIVIISVLIYQIKRKIPIHHFKKTH